MFSVGAARGRGAQCSCCSGVEHASAAMIDDGGWLKTGDLGYVDQGGYLYVVDRLKEMIKHRGMQVAPAELEAVLLVHPAIADAAMVASPYEETGEVPKAFVVRAGEANAGEIMAYVAERVAPQEGAAGEVRR